MTSRKTLLSLPDELTAVILHYVTPRDRLAVGVTCQCLNALVNSLYTKGKGENDPEDTDSSLPKKRVAILTPSDVGPGYYSTQLAKQRVWLGSVGIELVAVQWNEITDSQLDSVDGITPLVAWGYHLEPDVWHALLDRIEARGLPCANPVPVLRWSSDKSYLEALCAAGVPTVPTINGHGDEGDGLMERARAAFPDAKEFVVKPTVSASAVGTHRVSRKASLPADGAGKRLLVQPFQAQIMTAGELSLLYFGGVFSHAIVKEAKEGEFRIQHEYGGRTREVTAPDSARALADAALAVAPGATAYARVDMIDDCQGGWMIMELELVEPDCFMRHAPGGGGVFAAALRAAAAGDVPSIVAAVVGGADVGGVDPTTKASALHAASSGGHTEAVVALLSTGAAVDAGDAQRQTPLVVAASLGHLDVVHALLLGGACVDGLAGAEVTPVLAATLGGHTEVVEALVAKGVDDEFEANYRAVAEAAARGDVADR